MPEQNTVISTTCTTTYAAEISDEDVDEMEETVCVDTIARRANSSCTRTGLVVFVTKRFSEVFVVLYMTITIFS